VATGTKKKYDEFKKICSANGISIDVREIFELVDTYASPKEVSATYEGNTAEKIKAAFDAWHKMTEEERVKSLDHLGIKKSQAFILAEDSGFHFREPGLANEDEFRNIRHALNLEAPFPGVETGSTTIGSDGVQGFMKKIQSVFMRRAAKGQHIDDRVVKKSVIALAPLEQPKEYGALNMTMVASEVQGTVTFSPMPATGPIEIDNYLIPDAIPGSKRHQTEAKLGDKFYTKHSPRALAIQGLSQEMGMPVNPSRVVQDDFSKDFCAAIVVDDHSYASKSQAEKLTTVARGDGFGVITAPSSQTICCLVCGGRKRGRKRRWR
jgi:hypothetical protein